MLGDRKGSMRVVAWVVSVAAALAGCGGSSRHEGLRGRLVRVSAPGSSTVTAGKVFIDGVSDPPAEHALNVPTSGRYSAELPPGRYRVHGRIDNVDCPAIEVSVRARSFLTLDVACPVVFPASFEYADAYAGFALTPPPGWVQSSAFGMYAVAPEESRLAFVGHRDDHYSDEATFTVLVAAVQEMTFARALAGVRSTVASEGGVTQETETKIADRPATVVTQRRDPVTDQCSCVDRYTLVQWSPETILQFIVHAGSARRFDVFRERAAAMISSLRPSEPDPTAEVIRGFLRARIEGEGAEQWLTVQAREFYDEYGLYTIENDARVVGYRVRSAQPGGGATAFEVFLTSDASGRAERILVRSGSDDRSEPVLLVEQTQPTDAS